jgi:hypothetical protein
MAGAARGQGFARKGNLLKINGLIIFPLVALQGKRRYKGRA